jgi:transglutaminase/protease-like cytokinesis protein 3
MKNKTIKIIYSVSIFMIVISFSVCSSTPQPKSNVIERTTGKTVFSFSTNQPDTSIVNIPKKINDVRLVNPDEFIRQLALYIKKDKNNDFRIVKKIHDWIALNIRYDAKSYLSGNIPFQGYYNALASGMAVCAGYANLFKRICDELNIDCEEISGYARGYSYSLFDDEIITSNHAWNMVKIYDNWYLIDCTWDSGYLDGTRQVQKYKTDYLFIKPERMIYSHFPNWRTDQLLNPPISEDEFLNMPTYRPLFFKYITEVKPNLGKITKMDGRTKVNFYVNDNTYLMFEILNKYEKEMSNKNKICKFGNIGNRYEADFTFTETGEYIFRLFASVEKYGIHEWIADYRIIVTSGYVPTANEIRSKEIEESIKRDLLHAMN